MGTTVPAPTPATPRPIPAAKPTTSGQRALAALAYIGPLVVIPVLVRKKERFLAYHTRQGLYLFAGFVAAFLLTFGLLYLFYDRVLDIRPVFSVLSVILFLELVAYAGVVLYLAVQSGRGQMPMLPLLGDLAGES